MIALYHYTTYTNIIISFALRRPTDDWLLIIQFIFFSRVSSFIANIISSRLIVFQSIFYLSKSCVVCYSARRWRSRTRRPPATSGRSSLAASWCRCRSWCPRGRSLLKQTDKPELFFFSIKKHIISLYEIDALIQSRAKQISEGISMNYYRNV